MGYCYQRTAYPLESFAYKGIIINANDYPGISLCDRNIWEESRHFYEAIPKKGNGVHSGFFRIMNYFKKKVWSNSLKNIRMFLR